MSDESRAERLHLEGLDEATERERWEEAMSDCPDLPTTAGSVIEATYSDEGRPRLWMRTDHDLWVSDERWYEMEGDLTLVRVLFDAGKGIDNG